MRDAAAVLLDRSGDPTMASRIREAIEQNDNSVYDLHLWRLGPGHHGVIVEVVSDWPQPAQAYRNLMGHISGLWHITIETRLRDYSIT